MAQAQGVKTAVDPRLARALVVDELFDLTLYQKLQLTARGGLKKILDELIPVETAHMTFWQKFFNLPIQELGLPRRVKLKVLLGFCRAFGESGVHLVLEAIEIHGVRKYLAIWETCRDTPLGDAVKEILSDEFKHEDAIVSQMRERKIDPERVRSIFLGFNDGLVEILGAVSGFFAAFGHSRLVLIAGCTVAVAGSISMAAGAYAASSSEEEVEQVERGRSRFLGRPAPAPSENDPAVSAGLVGASYLVGALVPVLPVLFGASGVLVPAITGGGLAIIVSFFLSFLSGMNAARRIGLNLLIIAAAVGVTYAIGLLTKSLWGINV